MESKQSKGRKKLDLEKIENEANRFVCFSKRKSGLFKKANEISTLCGAETGFVVLSPTGKFFSFGSPSIDAITSRVMDQIPSEGDGTHPLVEARNQTRMDEVNMKYNELLLQTDAENDIETALKIIKEEKNYDRGWWDIPMAEFGSEQAKIIEASLKKLHESLCDDLKKKTIGSSSSTGAYATNPFGASGSGAAPPFFFATQDKQD